MNPTRASRRTILPWILVLAWMGVIFVLSAQSGLRISADADVDRPSRALAHVATYAILAGLILGALRASGWSKRSSFVGALAIAILYGVSDEIHQSFVPDRTGQARDVLLDAVGAILGVGASAILARRGGRRRDEPDEREGTDERAQRA